MLAGDTLTAPLTRFRHVDWVEVYEGPKFRSLRRASGAAPRWPVGTRVIANEELVEELRGQVTEYTIGKFQEEVLLAAIADENHPAEIRAWTKEAVACLREGFEALGGIETYPSHCNMVLCRFTDGRKAAPFSQAMRSKGIRIKVFEDLQGMDFSEYFRLTTGIPEENLRVIETAKEILQGA